MSKVYRQLYVNVPFVVFQSEDCATDLLANLAGGDFHFTAEPTTESIMAAVKLKNAAAEAAAAAEEKTVYYSVCPHCQATAVEFVDVYGDKINIESGTRKITLCGCGQQIGIERREGSDYIAYMAYSLRPSEWIDTEEKTEEQEREEREWDERRERAEREYYKENNCYPRPLGYCGTETDSHFYNR